MQLESNCQLDMYGQIVVLVPRLKVPLYDHKHKKKLYDQIPTTGPASILFCPTKMYQKSLKIMFHRLSVAGVILQKRQMFAILMYI